ncbi:MAG: serine/threonine-protein phosphatase [Methanospirillum sp.]|uniref:PP2C family protein-serine/threonine phosphatase n=1 Tax=Methanospirillum sp. TaxID=45200 RepID=UPI002373CD49|nr:PP2C family serine/threonine-protein phosphatase [Methanospirillum sp.]MDD1728324.1 serine/threonine-protein phosphatase [Methanospirillum sp.]
MGNQIKVFYFTNNGGVRPNNEDSLLITKTLVSDTSMEEPGSYQSDQGEEIFCVADGIGGAEKGEVASNLVLSTLMELQDTIRDEPSLTTALFQGKNALDHYANEHQEAFNLGCTVAGVCIREDSLLAFNIGDCRVYRINGNFFEQVTRDHSVVQALFDEGLITEEEMRHHPRKNVVTSSVSGDGNPDSMKVYTTGIHIRSTDIFLICSDGIWGCFSHDELELIYQRFQGYEYCEKILHAALARKASDNISAILIQISSIE